MTEIIIKKAKSLESFVLDDCYRVEDGPRCIFIRIFSLYSLSNFWEDRENDGRKNNSAPQLTTLLLQNTGKLIYPVFKIIRERKIFRTREDLLQFESVCALESDVAEAFANKKFESAIEPIKNAIGQFQALFKDEEIIEDDDDDEIQDVTPTNIKSKPDETSNTTAERPTRSSWRIFYHIIVLSRVS